MASGSTERPTHEHPDLSPTENLEGGEVVSGGVVFVGNCC